MNLQEVVANIQNADRNHLLTTDLKLQKTNTPVFWFKWAVHKISGNRAYKVYFANIKLENVVKAIENRFINIIDPNEQKWFFFHEMDVTHILNNFNTKTSNNYNERIREIWQHYARAPNKVKWQYFSDELDKLKKYKNDDITGPRLNIDVVLEALYDQMNEIVKEANECKDKDENKPLQLLIELAESQKKRIEKRAQNNKSLTAYGRGPGLSSLVSTESKPFNFQTNHKKIAYLQLARFYQETGNDDEAKKYS